MEWIAYAEEESRSDERYDDTKDVEDCETTFDKLNIGTWKDEDRQTSEKDGLTQLFNERKSDSIHLGQVREYSRRRESIPTHSRPYLRRRCEEL